MTEQGQLGACCRCGERCTQSSYEIGPDRVVCFDCVTDDELCGFDFGTAS